MWMWMWNWGCRVDGRYMVGSVKGGIPPGSSVLYSGMRRAADNALFQGSAQGERVEDTAAALRRGLHR
jgi:hypothetical protein